jgi:magnesium transporter
VADTSPAVSLRDDVRALLRARRWHPLRRLLAELHPADVAELAEALPEEEAEVALRLLGRRQSAVFEYLSPETQRRLLRRVSPEQLSAIVAAMSPDDRTHMLNAMPADVARALLGRLPPSELKRSLALLSYPEDTAGRYMTPDFAAISPEMNAGEALQSIRRTGRSKETLNIVYIVDARGRLVEDVRLGALVMADPSTPVTDIPDPGVVSLLDTTPREDVVRLFEKYDRVALPVTDEVGRILGIITVDDVLDVAEEEATEDIHKLGGMEALDLPYLQSGFWSMVRKRGGWLSALFLGEMLTATAMSRYEAEIARAVVLAVFVPLIISSGGNSGSQAASLIIRALALRELTLRHWTRVFGREVVAGVALGSILGAIGFVRIVTWQRLHITDYGPHYLLVAGTVCISLVGVVTFGSLAGSMLPFLLRRLGFDPATSSAPFVATLVDVTGLVIYFTVAALMLRGALL